MNSETIKTAGATTLAQIKELRARYRDELTKAGKEALRPAFDKFLADNPRVEAVRWEQYTPYFNDGEACEFGVYGFSLKIVGKDDGGNCDDGFLDQYALKRTTTMVKDGTKETKDWSGRVRREDNWVEKPCEAPGLTEAKALKALEAEVKDKEILKHVFGDHVQVTVTRSGIEVSEYRHD